MSATEQPGAIAIGNMHFLPHPDRPGVYVAGAFELASASARHAPAGDPWWAASFVSAGERVVWGFGTSPEDALANLAEDLRSAAVRAQEEADAFYRRWQAADREARNYARYLENLRTALFNEEPP